MNDYKWKIVSTLSISQKALIDYANLVNNLYLPQKKFCNKKDYDFYIRKKYLGLPLLLNFKNKYFFFKNNTKYFFLEKKEIAKGIYETDNLKYIGLNLFFKNRKFTKFAIPKKKYIEKIKLINSFNNLTKKNINKLKKQNKIIASFQTRNIPHYGHQKIVEYLLNYADIVVINPILGPKKSGDVKNHILKESWQFLINKYYIDKVYFYPIIANMFYAGPREALHHTLLRQNLNFDYFCVGRDHAGAEKLYNPNSAFEIAKIYKNKFKIKIVNIKGAFYCKLCKDYVVKDSCNHHYKYLLDISGDSFRQKLKNKKTYKHADKELQKFLFSKYKNLFQ